MTDQQSRPKWLPRSFAGQLALYAVVLVAFAALMFLAGRLFAGLR